jgi:hypothetical protein
MRTRLVPAPLLALALIVTPVVLGGAACSCAPAAATGSGGGGCESSPAAPTIQPCSPSGGVLSITGSFTPVHDDPQEFYFKCILA